MKRNVLPFAHLAFDPDAPAHHLHEALADGKPEARASETPRHGSVGLGEGLEEMLQAGGRDADSAYPARKTPGRLHRPATGRERLTSTSPCSVNLMAFPARLSRTCCNRIRSPTTASGVSSGMRQ